MLAFITYPGGAFFLAPALCGRLDDAGWIINEASAFQVPEHSCSQAVEHGDEGARVESSAAGKVR
jgi:hypothetical protein